MVTKIANWVKPPFYLVCKSYQIIHIHRPVERFWTTLTMFLFILFLHSNLSALVQLSPSLLFPMILFVDFSSTFYAVILALWQDSQLSVYDLQVDHRHLVWQEVVREHRLPDHQHQFLLRLYRFRFTLLPLHAQLHLQSSVHQESRSSDVVW